MEENLAADVTGALLRGGPLPQTTCRAVAETLGQAALDALVLLTTQYQAAQRLRGPRARRVRNHD
ncbi:hypothetical protein LWP59_25445 [Amycolatopsis acidiphila]|uniref:Uncharacterized protein n=1 Tax=Amycolatopsis acidiphila TaxID=715473 RepID=A0A558ALC6_9PSEU|nr:hypothetical protein [Amycolatopsis acidiphila]TVT25011.1 hypothetical protein FNH06_04110 [Amycolatopsis acidiphila]UIJ57481.1 hypothetical protein LWP59_25445 [Amycolatopsis acidiphila]GHG96333.1 hypothetical protein GCM10017788_75340 [Amycolatopsis acidiphila]